MQDTRYVAVLEEAIERVETRGDLREHYTPTEFSASLLEYGEAARGFIAARVRQGDFASLHRSRDPYYIPAVQAMLDVEVTPWTFHQAVSYLWNVDTPEAVDVLRAAYEGGLPSGEERHRTRPT